MEAEGGVWAGTPLELRELQAFLAVAACGSYTRAARALRFDQSTVTRHVQRLERDLRIVLFFRSSGGIELTEHGRQFLPHARRVVDAARRAAHFARALAPDERCTG